MIADLQQPTNTADQPLQISRPFDVAPHEPHYRLTEDVLGDQLRAGLLTIKGYIFYLIKSGRKDGWKFRIHNVLQFCRDHGISKSSFYRALGELEEIGALIYRAIGGVEIQVVRPQADPDPVPVLAAVPNLGQVSQDWEEVSQDWEKVSQTWESDPVDPCPSEAHRDSSDLLQISTNLSQSAGERERAQLDQETSEIRTFGETDTQVPCLTTNSDDLQGDPDNQIDFSQGDPYNWLEDYAGRHGKGPGWIRAVIRNPDPVIQKAYRSFRSGLERSQKLCDHVDPAELAQKEEQIRQAREADPIGFELRRLQGMWSSGLQWIRERVVVRVDEIGMEYGITIGVDGPQEMEF